MKVMLGTAALTLSLLLALPVSAATPVKATLTLPYDHVLPGVPFDLIVTYTNVSDRPVTINGALATLVVTFADGETSVMHQPEGHDQSSIRRTMPVRLASGESVEYASSWDGGIPNWFRYESFSGPGTYGIALDLRIYDDDENVIGTIRTPAVALTRIEPAGIDAALWKRMQEVSGGRWSDMSFKSTKPGVALADEIIQLHPASGYYPYVLALRAQRPDKNHIPALLEAAERFPTSPAYPHLLAAAANCARYAGAVAADQGDAAEAQKYFALAEAGYREALATRNALVIRSSSEDGLQELTWRRERLTKKPRR